MNYKKIIYGLLALGIIAGIAVYFYVFHFGAKHADPLKSANTIHIQAADLYHMYEDYEDSAKRLYNGKTILVNGEIETIEYEAPRYTVNLKTGSDIGVVMCEMDTVENETVKLLKAGAKVEIAGFCNGINLDVYLDRCKLAK